MYCYSSLEWRAAHMGLCNAPSHFQCMMHLVLFDLLDCEVVVYLDDVLIYLCTLEKHHELLKAVSVKLKKIKLNLK